MKDRDTVRFELASPERLLFNKDVLFVTVPGSAGLYGVLPGHVPMMTTLEAGLIEVYEDDEHSVSKRFFVTGGFADVNAERCTVMAEEAVPVSELDHQALEAEIAPLYDIFLKAETDEARDEAEANLAMANARLSASVWARSKSKDVF